MSKKISKKIEKLESLKKQVAKLESKLSEPINEGKVIKNQFKDFLIWSPNPDRKVLVGVLENSDVAALEGHYAIKAMVVDNGDNISVAVLSGLNLKVSETTTATPKEFKKAYKKAMKALNF